MPDSFFQKKNSLPVSHRRPSPAAHSGKCTICHHPERAEIERAFLDWTPPYTIMRDFHIVSRNAIYRHAHAFGLFDRRQRSLRMALDRLIEQVDYVKPTASSIISAIALMAKLNEKEKLAEEPAIAEEEDSPAISSSEDGACSPQPAAKQPSSRGSSGDSRPGSAEAAEPLRNSGHSAATPAEESTAEKRKEPRKPAKDGAGPASSDPPITFAENVGPRRRFFWR